MYMKKSRKIRAGTLLLLAALCFTFIGGQTIQAADTSDKVAILGSGLNEAERTATLEQLKVDSGQDITVDIVNGTDAGRFIDATIADRDMISSVMVEFKSEGSGVSSEIVYPENITKIIDYQYSNAAITAGIYDCHITVAAIRPVTGESALTGVYKAAEVYGIDLDKDKLVAGNDELITVRVIEDNNANNEDFDSEDFSKALTEIKAELAELVEKEGKDNITIEQITVIINNVLNKYEINISQADIDKQAATLEKYKNTLSAEDVKKVLDQLKTFGEDTWGMAMDFLEGAEDSGWWTNVSSFFSDLFKAIGDFFSNLFD